MAIKTTITIITLLTILVTFGHATANLVSSRDRRSDDHDPLQPVVSLLTEKVDQLTAQLQAQDFQLEAQAARIAAMEQPVAFTATFSDVDVENLGQGQTLKFSSVVFNVGSGYNPNTGLFTAPSAGTYLFYMHIMMNMNHAGDVEVDLYKENRVLVRAGACCTGHVSGANMAAVRLEKGETIRAQLSRGTMLWGNLHSTFSGVKISSN